ncbi:MAG: hypothetical protein FJX89_06755 [Bacteroidetes bacterium]|nr:hypothetical protein [Bacteroidota bacterium]
MQEPYTTFRHHLQYAPVFECRVLHDYFPGGQCRVLEISPTPETSASLSGLGLLYRPLPDGFLLIANASRDWANPVYQRPAVFDFSFRVKDPQFIRYTNIPYRSGQFHVFDSQTGVDGALHPGAFVDEVSLTEADTDGIGGLIRVRHEANAPILPGAREAAPPVPETSRVRYIRFLPREAYVRYLFYSKSLDEEATKNFFVENFVINGVLHMFTLPRHTSMRDGSPAFEVLSQNPISLRQSYEAQGFLRRKRMNRLPFEYRKLLPMPRPENLVQDPQNGLYICNIPVKL